MMKYIKPVLLGLAFIFLVMMAFSLLVPSHIKISRTLNVSNASGALAQVSDLAKWKNWYPGLQNIALKNTVTQNGKIISAVAGNVALKVLSADTVQVRAVLQNGKKPVHATWSLLKYPGADAATLQQYMEFDLPWYPWEKLAGLLFDKQYGPVMEEGLKNLSAF